MGPQNQESRSTGVAFDAKHLVGNTPLIRLSKFASEYPHELWAKCEFLNLTGSVKDRAAFAMVAADERNGRITPGRTTLVEATAGNTGAALAAAACGRYRLKVVMMDKFGPEKVSMMKAWGAQVIMCRSNVSSTDPGFWLNTASRIAKEEPDHVYVDQFNHPANLEAHYHTTGPEIWEQTDGGVEAVVGGFGTGGTLMGIARFLKKRSRATKIVLADPEGSILAGRFAEVTAKPYLVEGIGSPFLPPFFDDRLLDDAVCVPDREAFLACLRLARTEGLLVGGSSGCALAGALRFMAAARKKPLRIVIILPDGGDRYLSTIFSAEWRRQMLGGSLEAIN